LTELRQAIERATPGPWVWDGVGKHGYPQRITANNDGLVLVAETFWGDLDTPPPDAEFIAFARTWLPALLDVAEASQRLPKRWSDKCGNCPWCNLDEALAGLEGLEQGL
ncbi:MAG: hypothetical protein WCB85_15015, partial [Candidatus Dormiibacterota bacterium]